MNKYMKATGIGLLGAAAATIFGAEAHESFYMGKAYELLEQSIDSITSYTKAGVGALGSLTALGLTIDTAIKSLKGKKSLDETVQ